MKIDNTEAWIRQVVVFHYRIGLLLMMHRFKLHALTRSVTLQYALTNPMDSTTALKSTADGPLCGNLKLSLTEYPKLPGLVQLQAQEEYAIEQKHDVGRYLIRSLVWKRVRPYAKHNRAASHGTTRPELAQKFLRRSH